MIAARRTRLILPVPPSGTDARIVFRWNRRCSRRVGLGRSLPLLWFGSSRWPAKTLRVTQYIRSQLSTRRRHKSQEQLGSLDGLVDLDSGTPPETHACLPFQLLDRTANRSILPHRAANSGESPSGFQWKGMIQYDSRPWSGKCHSLTTISEVTHREISQELWLPWVLKVRHD